VAGLIRGPFGARKVPRSWSRPALVAPQETGTVIPERDEPLANLGVRVRRSLDDRMSDLIHDLRRRHGIRISKAELFEVLLAELPASATPDFIARVNAFRATAPRRS
jgi:hypothetical protein